MNKQSQPHDHEAEQAVIGAMLLHPSGDEITELLRCVGSIDFHCEANRRIYAAIEIMHAARVPIDVVALVSHLRATGDFDAVGGAKYIATLSGAVPNVANGLHYARIVAELALRRHVIEIAHQASDEAASTNTPSRDVLLAMRSKIDRIMAESYGDDQCVTLHDAAAKRYAMMTSPDEQAAGALLGTGIGCLDDTYGGFRTGGLYVVAARPGNGKSALMKQMINAMDGRGKPTLMVSLEMDADEVAARILSERTGIDGKFLEVGEDGRCRLNKAEQSRVQDVVNDCQHSVIEIAAPTGRNATFEAIAAMARLHKARRSIRLLAIDYLQILPKSDPRKTDYQHVTDITKAAKQLARELGITVLLLSQLNRSNERDAKPRRPRLSDLRDSGSIEQDADGVIALHRLTEHQEDFELLTLKWRNDSPGTFPVRLVGELTKFDAPDIEDHPNYQDDFAEFA